MDKLRVGLVQMSVHTSKEENLMKAQTMVRQAAQQGAKFVILPEMFNCPYDSKIFANYAEEEGELTWQCLSNLAKDNNIYLVGGSMPEIDREGNVYNTSFIFDNTGKQIAKHRKMHLFDIDIEGGQYFKESDTLTSGNDVTVFETPYGKIGVIICYDIRFPELSRLMVNKGAKVIIVPGAFNMTTGPAHWELLFRTRALDNQVYTIGVAPARNVDAAYVSYGNSIIADPWGEVVDSLKAKEGMLVRDLNLTKLDKIRNELPLLKHVRKDIYKLIQAE